MFNLITYSTPPITFTNIVRFLKQKNPKAITYLQLGAGQWHTVRALESGSVLLEMKDGKYEPLGPEDILSL